MTRKPHPSEPRIVPVEDVQAPAPEEPVTAEESFAALLRERDDLQSRFRRLAADMDNYRKRVQTELTDARQSGKAALLKDVLPVVDNLERALDAADAEPEDNAILQGLRLVHQQLLDVMKSHGVEQMVAVGRPFDPRLHEAVSRVETTDQPPNTVVSELHKGYCIGDRTLRPARVVVALPPEPPEEEKEEAPTPSPAIVW